MPFSLIGVLQRHCTGIDCTCPDSEPPALTSLAEVLDRTPDPRRVQGRRYRLGSLLALCPAAVLGGATSPAAIARFAWDTSWPAWTATHWTTPWAPGSPDTPPTRSTTPGDTLAGPAVDG